MFRWARTDKEQINYSAYSHKSCTQTQVQTYVASPAHSKYSVNSLRDNSSHKLKYLTPTKKKQIKVTKTSAPFIQNSITKTELIKLVTRKKNCILKSQKQPYKIESINNRKPIKIRIQVNNTIDEYCRVLQQLKNKPWGIFVMGSIFVNMGFIEDLVTDRNLIKQIWQILNQPDALAVYVFLQQILGNKVQIQTAIKLINNSCYFCIEDANQSKNLAILIITQKIGYFLYETLRTNRINRQKSTFSHQKITDFSN